MNLKPNKNRLESLKPRESASDETPEAAKPRGKAFRTGKISALPFQRKEAETSEFVEKVIAIKRVTKVNKGGKKLSFSALVIVGDGKGKIGYSLGKAGEVASAIKKALLLAKRTMVNIPLKGTTIPHEIIGVCGASEVLLKPAVDGTGVIAAGPVRAICDGVGIRNILTKCHRSNNPINVIKATMDGLTRLKPFAAQAAESAKE